MFNLLKIMNIEFSIGFDMFEMSYIRFKSLQIGLYLDVMILNASIVRNSSLKQKVIMATDSLTK